MLVDAVKTRLATIPALINRVQTAADLTELFQKKALPQATLTAFVLPLGLRPTSAGDSISNAFTQMADDTIGILLLSRSAGDVTGARALPPIDALIDLVIQKICGWMPAAETNVVSDFRLARGALLSAEAGLVAYQLDFSIQKQIRVVA